MMAITRGDTGVGLAKRPRTRTANPDCQNARKPYMLLATRTASLCQGGSPDAACSRTMRRKSAFSQSHFWENVGMFLFVVAGLVGLWYVINDVLSW